ncbi:MAG: hypothetical protein V7603_5113 [Micromonosporaceae bacterium]
MTATARALARGAPTPLPVTPRADDPVVWAAAVRCLPALPAVPPPDGEAGSDQVRYHPVALTAAWLAEADSMHTRRGYFRDLVVYLAWCASRHPRLDPLSARAADVGVFRAALRTQVADSTVRRRLAALSSWYTYLLANGAVAFNPVAGVKRPRARRDASTTVSLSYDDSGRLLDAAEEIAAAALAHLRARRPLVGQQLVALRNRALLRLMVTMGPRVGEVASLDVASQSYNQGRRTLRYTAKGGVRRERSVDAYVWDAVDDYLAGRATADAVPVPALTGPLFATSSGGRLDEPAVRKLIQRIARYAGLPMADRLSPHSLRHGFNTVARQQGVDLERRQRAMGHADPRTTQVYDHAHDDLHDEPGLVLGPLYGARASRRAGQTPSEDSSS